MTVPGFNALSGISNTGNNLNTTLITASRDGQFSVATQTALRTGLQDLQSLASAYGLGSVFTYNKLSTNLINTKSAIILQIMSSHLIINQFHGY
jgi:hypothetical protein